MFAIISIIVILVIFAYFIHDKNKLPKELEGIPSASIWPTLWSLLRKKHHDEIEETIAKYSGGYDIYLNRLIGQTAININDPTYLKDFFTNLEDDDPPKISMPSGGALSEFFGDGLIFSNGNKWRTYRKLANPAFNNALSPEFVGETTFELFNFMQQNLNRPVDIFEIMQRTTIELLGKLAFGYQFGAMLEICRNSSYYKSHNRKFFKANEEFNEFVSDIIKAKRNEIENTKDSNNENSKNGRIDLLTGMLQHANQEGISTDFKQLRDEMVGFFVAGHDTTSMALSTSFYFLAKHPEMQERAREEVISVLGNEPLIPTTEQLKAMKYINAVIKESLRIYPPSTAIIPRKLKKPKKIGPYLLPANVICSTNIWQINHHPKYWVNPEQYNPERFLNNEKIHAFSWIPFSSGARN
ncbi:519_t:CDS:2, partial [Funneliformis geosporum]